MLQESAHPSNTRPSRRLRDCEEALIVAMVRGLAGGEVLLAEIDGALVEEMNDGGMGSVRFVRPDTHERARFGKELSQANGTDEDGVALSITLNVDQNGHLFELDVFKADNSQLLKFPALSDVVLRPLREPTE